MPGLRTLPVTSMTSTEGLGVAGGATPTGDEPVVTAGALDASEPRSVVTVLAGEEDGTDLVAARLTEAACG